MVGKIFKSNETGIAVTVIAVNDPTRFADIVWEDAFGQTGTFDKDVFLEQFTEIDPYVK